MPRAVSDPVARVRALVGRRRWRRHGLRRAQVACSGGADSIALADAAAAALGAATSCCSTSITARPPARPPAAHAEAWARGARPPLRVAAGRRRRRRVVGGAARARALPRPRRAGRPGELIAPPTPRAIRPRPCCMRIVRGTGPAGLARHPAARGRFVRPLLAVSRAEIDAYVAAPALPPWHDPMNDDPRFARVRVRARSCRACARENPRGRGARCAGSPPPPPSEPRSLDAPRTPLLRQRRAAPTRWRARRSPPRPPAIAQARARSLAARPRGIGRRRASTSTRCSRWPAGPTAGTRGLDLPGGRVERVYDRARVAPHRVGPTSVPRLSVDGPDGPYALRAWRPGDRMGRRACAAARASCPTCSSMPRCRAPPARPRASSSAPTARSSGPSTSGRRSAPSSGDARRTADPRRRPVTSR